MRIEIIKLLFVAMIAVSCGKGALSMSSEDHETSMLLHDIARGGIVNKPGLALRISELLIADIYGEEELEMQRPLEVEEKDDRWLITGSHNKDREVEGLGPAEVIMSKKDGRILSISMPRILKVPPEVKEIIKKGRSVGK